MRVSNVAGAPLWQFAFPIFLNPYSHFEQIQPFVASEIFFVYIKEIRSVVIYLQNLPKSKAKL